MAEIEDEPPRDSSAIAALDQEGADDDQRQTGQFGEIDGFHVHPEGAHVIHHGGKEQLPSHHADEEERHAQHGGGHDAAHHEDGAHDAADIDPPGKGRDLGEVAFASPPGEPDEENQHEADRNGDGKLSDAEKENLIKMIISRFPRSDADGDGTLSEKELEKVIKIATARAKNQGERKLI